MNGHVTLPVPAAPTAGALPGAIPYGVATLEQRRRRRRSGSGCSRRRMGRAGTRCVCNGKLARNSRCR